MSARTRMFKTLAALAVSMTVCALLLAWMEPTGVHDRIRLDSASIDRHIADILGALPPGDGPRSGRIEIRACGLSAGSSSMLTSASTSGCDFVVFSTDRVGLGRRWRQSEDEAPLVPSIHICVAATSGFPNESKDVWNALRLLLGTLHAHFHSLGASSSVHVDPSIQPLFPRLFAALPELLEFEGFENAHR